MTFKETSKLFFFKRMLKKEFVKVFKKREGKS